MISIVVPTFNPNIEEFKIAIETAIETNSDEIIIVDDCSDKSNIEYFNYLEELKNEPKVKIYYNEINKGRFLNSYYALTLAKNKYVKKLDSDDQLISDEFNKLLLEDHDESIIFTKYKFKNKQKNKANNNRWNIFNGSVVYKTEELKDLDLSNTPINFFGDIIFITHITSKDNSTIGYSLTSPYRYMIVGSTTPKKLLEKHQDWLMGYDWVKKTSNNRKELKFTIEKQDIFYEIMMVKLKRKHTKANYTYFKSWNLTPTFIKKIVSYFTFKF